MQKAKTWTNVNSEENIKHMAFIEHQHVCALCGSDTYIEVLDHDIINALITEHSSCPECKIKTRVKKHTVQ